MNKSALRRLALEVREEVNLTPHDPFNPLVLADLYGVDVIRLSEVQCSSEALGHFEVTRPDVFSGALVPFSDGSTVIIENDFHAMERRVSTASHEMSHVVLEHPFRATLANAKGCRIADQEQEAEAAELSGELLIPFEAAKRLAFHRVSDEEAARRFGVSIELARWRMNATGARKIANRAHAKRQLRGGKRT
jgi:Zn-dependent peptidase ImmA (M78 family)